IAPAQGGRMAGASGRAPHQRRRLRLRLQRSVLFQPLLPPPLRPDADSGAGKIKRFQAKHALGLDPGVETGSHDNQVYADCVDLSAVENASKQESRANATGDILTQL